MVMTSMAQQTAYQQTLAEIKKRILGSQMRAVLAVNAELIALYWQIGADIVNLQQTQGWGSAVVEQMAKDLKTAHPKVTGFSRTNLFAMRQFYSFFVPQYQIVPQPVGQIPWGHIRMLLAKTKTIETALFYAQECVVHGWSRDMLGLQIEQKLHERLGNAPTNFNQTLPMPQSSLAQQTLKDPYVFDFLDLTAKAQERDVEHQLVNQITKFLLELGKGFAFIGRQYPMAVNDKDYFLDMLFYHTRLKCYVVIELKIGEFKPEFVGKMNFYLSAVDDLLKDDHDQPSIGIILCKNKDKLDVEYALRDINKPIGVSSFITNALPADVQPQLPTIEELEAELASLTDVSESYDE